MYFYKLLYINDFIKMYKLQNSIYSNTNSSNAHLSIIIFVYQLLLLPVISFLFRKYLWVNKN